MNDAQVSNAPFAANAKRLLWASSLGIFATGVGFAIRGGILGTWGADFGFNASQLGAISGAAFSSFCFGIIIGGLVCDKIGYGKLIALALTLHLLSAAVTIAAVGPGAYGWLFWGTAIFGLANGVLESVVNPLVATLYPHNRAHFLNVLHASWPAGLALGAAIAWVVNDHLHLNWRLQMCVYLIPTLAYGFMFLGQAMPKSEAARQGLRLGEMLKDIGLLGTLLVCFLLGLFLHDTLRVSPAIAWGVSGALLISVGVITRFSLGSVILFVLFLAHALVGAVEIGTDGWIQNITGNLLTSEQGKFLFIATSITMFILRFCVNFFERRVGMTPLGILLGSSLLACLGLNLTSAIATFGGALFAVIVYAVGKTFFWPTMLAVASDRFPRTGAIAIAIMGGLGYMAAGQIGTPGLGYAKDRFAGEHLNQVAPADFAQYQAATPSKFLFFHEVHGLDGFKLGAVQAHLVQARLEPGEPLNRLTESERMVLQASIAGDRKTLKVDSLIPAAMAVIYLLLLLYFKLAGGYRKLTLTETTLRPSNLPTGPL